MIAGAVIFQEEADVAAGHRRSKKGEKGYLFKIYGCAKGS
jgi:hypothetical protein